MAFEKFTNRWARGRQTLQGVVVLLKNGVNARYCSIAGDLCESAAIGDFAEYFIDKKAGLVGIMATTTGVKVQRTAGLAVRMAFTGVSNEMGLEIVGPVRIPATIKNGMIVFSVKELLRKK